MSKITKAEIHSMMSATTLGLDPGYDALPGEVCVDCGEVVDATCDCACTRDYDGVAVAAPTGGLRRAIVVIVIFLTMACSVRGAAAAPTEERINVAELEAFVQTHEVALAQLAPVEREQFDRELRTVVQSRDSQGYATVKMPSFLAGIMNGLGWVCNGVYSATRWLVVGTGRNIAWCWNGTLGRIHVEVR